MDPLAETTWVGLWWARSPPAIFPGGFSVPWYWTDDLSRIMISEGLIGDDAASGMVLSPVAIRREESSLEEAAKGMADDDEIPLAA